MGGPADEVRLDVRRADEEPAELGHVDARGVLDPIVVEVGSGHWTFLREALARVGDTTEGLVEVVVVVDGGLTDFDRHASHGSGGPLAKD